MHRFRVWAPRKKGADVVVDGRRVAMEPTEGGWWEAGVAGARPGSRYGLSVDGGEVRPDPRSPSQPDGVFSLSEVVDHSAFQWHDQQWKRHPLKGSITYELHIGTFSPRGTFDGAIEHLDHLVELGVDAVELMPVAEFAGDHGWGYDGVDLYAPHHAYGGPDGMKCLVDACHHKGLAVVLDVVYNHLGPAGNFLPEFGPYFTDRHRTGWGEAVNFDGRDSFEVRRFFLDNALMWIRDYHVDGLRLDAVFAIVDESSPHFLEELAAVVHEAGAFAVAESDLKDPRLLRKRDAGGFELDGVWSDDWHHSLHSVLTGERAGYYAEFGSWAQLANVLRMAWVRRSVPASAPEAFVVATQNHDQVGNRAAGERLARLVDGTRLRAAAALLLTTPFTPILFMGEEWAASTPFQYFTDHDADLGRAVSEGRKREFSVFGWGPDDVPDPQDPATFERSKLNWEELEESPHREMLEWYRGLMALRRRLPPATGIDVEVDEADQRIFFARAGVKVLVNLGEGDWNAKLERPMKVVLASRDGIAVEDHMICLPASTVAVLEG
jgi:maltooligosyltrehalose trehalohydrolase